MTFRLLDPKLIASGFFEKNKKIYHLITNYQLDTYGVDKDFKKFVTTSKNIDPIQKTYSFFYAIKKRKLVGDAGRFNLKLTGKFHSSFYQKVENEEVKIFIGDKFFLSKKYPSLLQFSNQALNLIIKGNNEYVSEGLLQYTRKYIRKSLYFRK